MISRQPKSARVKVNLPRTNWDTGKKLQTGTAFLAHRSQTYADCRPPFGRVGAGARKGHRPEEATATRDSFYRDDFHRDREDKLLGEVAGGTRGVQHRRKFAGNKRRSIADCVFEQSRKVRKEKQLDDVTEDLKACVGGVVYISFSCNS